MPLELRVPSLGESIREATVGAWLKKEGDAVQTDEPLVEVESEKATVVVPAPAAGVLRRILKATGATVAVGEVIAELEPGAAPSPRPSPPSGERERTAADRQRPVAMESEQGAPAPARPFPTAADRQPPVAMESEQGAPARAPPFPLPRSSGGEGQGEGVARATVTHLSPSARRRLAESGGPTPDGTVRALDLRRGMEAPAPAASPPGPRERLVPMSPLRRTVARRLLEAQQSAAILTTFNEVDLSRVLALREQHGPAFEKKHGVKLGFMSFFVKAAVEALKAFPAVNAEVRGADILYKDHYDIGVAVGGGKGLVVPVVRDADLLSFAQVEQRIGELARKARENRITLEELEGGTFTISNGGVYGSLLSTPILNPPQSGILGLHKIQKRPVADPGDEVRVRPMMYLALSYDHRLVDGREAVSFLIRVKDCIEDPERVLLEI